jgi:hypothetical protein
VSTLKKSQAISPFAWAARNSAQVGPDRRGDASTPWRFKIAQTLEGAMAMPMVARLPEVATATRDDRAQIGCWNSVPAPPGTDGSRFSRVGDRTTGTIPERA